MRLVFVLIVGLVVGCASNEKKVTAPPPDDHLWLEDVQGEKAITWVKEQNAQSLRAIESLPTYKRSENELRAIVLSKDRIPYVKKMGNYLYNFWQDDKHVRGIWRRVSIDGYRRAMPPWETVLDLDKLAKQENENWTMGGQNCLPPAFTRCLIEMSRAGKDAGVVREFDTARKEFVRDGFQLPEAKSRVDWMDQNNIFVATDFGPGSLTASGYPRIVKHWRRGQPLSAAKTLLEGKVSDIAVGGGTFHGAQGVKAVVYRALTFFSDETFEYSPDGRLKKIEKPDTASVVAWMNGHFLVSLRDDWQVRGETFKSGGLIALPLIENGTPKTVFQPTPVQSLNGSFSQTKDALFVGYMDSIEERLARVQLKGDAWSFESLNFPPKGMLEIQSADSYGDTLIVNYMNYLTPMSVMRVKAGIEKSVAQIKPETLKQAPARFNSDPFMVQQLWATSRDGTKIPYYLLRAKAMKFDGGTPTIIYGYGGFQVSETPYYSASIGKLWLEKGGAYVVANIRGGGEFGPRWHQAAQRENRQKAFDDFIAVAEDVKARGISRPEKMGIRGGSNGGLLVGATFVQRPDLYRAVLCEVPLLDMYRYNQLLAGASWEEEYGKPDDPKAGPAIARYSPYQNVKSGVKYPEVFFTTSTADDRVHPGHARKMVARMKAQGHKVEYFENMEGGHSAAANLLQRVKMSTLQYTFLQDRLMGKN
ncbi:MAG TPA: prolyl oligopeptidase family serine peptidase [Bdellovibrionales bacterium]|nr:prolyl oligopeptidase family serine peptidase [Bdellovibrionales bacterium]